MKHIVFFLFLLTSTSVFAQRPGGGRGAAAPGTGSIVGKIIDGKGGGPVEFAAIGLWQGDKALDGTLTDTKGKFEFQNLKKGTYKLVISFIGYKPFTQENIVLSSNSDLIKLKDITIEGDVNQLEEVTVTGQGALVEDKIDRLVYNADKDISNRGVSAEEVLRKVPMLSVDLDGNVSLRGSSNIKVLINNKPSTIFAASIGDALKQIPSDQIKSVEVITAPGAKYDGEGTGGIVNINLKKNTLAGINGLINAGAGLRSSSVSGNLNLRDKKWGISLGGDSRFSYNLPTESTLLRTSTVDNVNAYLEQFENATSIWGHGGYRATFDYDLNAKTNFAISYSGRTRKSGGDGDQITRNFDENRDLVNESTRFIDQIKKSNSYDLDFTFLKKYNNPVKELSFLAQVSNNRRDEDFTTLVDYLPADSSLNEGNDKEYTVQLDYVHPIKETVKLEIGSKAILRNATSNGTYYSMSEGAYLVNEARSNYLVYDQNVFAGYSALTFKLPNDWGLQAGARYEYTTIDATFKDELAGTEIPDYGTLLPNIYLTKKIDKIGTFRASFSQRIQRPSIRYLNPYVNQVNVTDISYGNPTLAPEKSNQYELNYSTYWKANSLNVSVYTKSIDNAINSLKTIERTDGVDVTETTYLNIGEQRNNGVNISLNFAPTQKFRIGGGADFNHVYVNNGVLSNKGWEYGGRMFSSWMLPKDYSVSAFLFARGPNVELQGGRKGFVFHGLSFKKDLFKKKGSIGFTLETPFTKYISMNSYFTDNSSEDYSFEQDYTRKMYRRSFKIDFSYRFGKMDQNGLFNKRKKIDNNDQKGDDSGGMM